MLRIGNFATVFKSWSARRLEYRYLSDLSGEPKIWGKIARIESWFQDRISDELEFKKTNGHNLMLQGMSAIFYDDFVGFK